MGCMFTDPQPVWHVTVCLLTESLPLFAPKKQTLTFGTHQIAHAARGLIVSAESPEA